MPIVTDDTRPPLLHPQGRHIALHVVTRTTSMLSSRVHVVTRTTYVLSTALYKDDADVVLSVASPQGRHVCRPLSIAFSRTTPMSSSPMCRHKGDTAAFIFFLPSQGRRQRAESDDVAAQGRHRCHPAVSKDDASLSWRGRRRCGRTASRDKRLTTTSSFSPNVAMLSLSRARWTTSVSVSGTRVRLP